MVRAKLEIKYIEEKSRRHTAFTKRRQGLIKKTQGFAGKFDAQAAAIVFSKAGNVFAFGHPSVESLVSRYLADPEKQPSGEEEEEEEEATPSAAALTEDTVAKRIGAALEKGNWDSAVDGLEPREIDKLLADILEIKRAVEARVTEVAARGYDRK